MIDNNYEIVFHLVGKQQIPNLLGIQNISSKKHVFIYTKEYNDSHFKQLISNNYEFDTLLVDAYNIDDIKNKLENYLNDKKHLKIAFNLTGGTKIMSFALYDISNKTQADSYYFDTQNRKVLCINTHKEYQIKTITDLNTFFQLGSDIYTIENEGIKSLSQQRQSITYLLFKYRSSIKSIIKKYDEINSEHATKSFLSGWYGKIYIEYINSMHYKLKIDNVTCEIENIDFKKYLNGMWFEEYIFSIIQKYNSTHNKLFDLRTGVRLKSQQSSDLFHELDVIFTDGINMHVIECKTGNTCHDDVNKIKSVTEVCGGTFAKSIFISIKENKSILQRNSSQNCFFNANIEDGLLNYLNRI